MEGGGESRLNNVLQKQKNILQNHNVKLVPVEKKVLFSVALFTEFSVQSHTNFFVHFSLGLFLSSFRIGKLVLSLLSKLKAVYSNSLTIPPLLNVRIFINIPNGSCFRIKSNAMVHACQAWHYETNEFERWKYSRIILFTTFLLCVAIRLHGTLFFSQFQ